MVVEKRDIKERTLREEARQAKRRIKNGFWQDCERDLDRHLEIKAGRYFAERVSAQIAGEKEDDFYLRVKEMLLENGEVSDAIGRLTDKPYYDTLTYAEKQRYNLTLSEKYLRALERFRKEYQFDNLHKNA